MERIFYKKWTAAIFVALILVVVLLTCMLLVLLTQMSSLNERADTFVELIKEARKDEEKQRELIEYMKTNEYVKEWAEKHNLIDGDDVTWIEELTSSK